MGSVPFFEIEPIFVIGIAISIHSTGKNRKTPRNRNSLNYRRCTYIP